MTKQLEGLCPHGRLTTAVCLDCGIEAEMYRPIIPDPLTDEFGSKQVNWKKESWDPLEAYYVPNAEHTGGSSDYYDLPPDCTRLHDVIVKQDMQWSQANIFKAAYRWDKKPDLEYNLRKIIWFASDELSRLEKLKDAGPKTVKTRDQSELK